VGPLIDRKGVLVNDDRKMGDLLNTYFASVFTNEDITFASGQTNICLWSNKSFRVIKVNV